MTDAVFLPAIRRRAVNRPCVGRCDGCWEEGVDLYEFACARCWRLAVADHRRLSWRETLARTLRAEMWPATQPWVSQVAEPAVVLPVLTLFSLGIAVDRAVLLWMGVGR